MYLRRRPIIRRRRRRRRRKRPTKGSTTLTVRTSFPETWLWSSVVVGQNGTAILNSKAPDTITTWVANAFAIERKNDFVVATKPAQLVTFRDLFLSLDLPYSIIRGEIVCFQVSVFNYKKESLPVILIVERSPEYEVVVVYRQGGQVIAKSRHTRLCRFVGFVHPYTPKGTYFCVKPVSLGHIVLKVLIMSLWNKKVLWDGVHRRILVEPEGVPRSNNEFIFGDLRYVWTFTHTFTIAFPKHTVKGSERVRISVAGDIFGSTLNNLNNLLRMPYGCGEQNMVNFAPNIYACEYLQKTKRLTAPLLAKARKNMEAGYQRQLRYQHRDGSFSAFGESIFARRRGSMWLTAFVVTCFSRGTAWITIDDRVIIRAALWMIRKQKTSGSFPEPGVVFNKRLQGGSGTGVALTSYVLISLTEARNALISKFNTRNRQRLKSAVDKAQRFIVSRLSKTSDPYEVAICAYALVFSKSPKAGYARRKLDSLAKTEPGLKYWERSTKQIGRRYFWYRRTQAINIEATAYALLVYAKQLDIAGGVPIIRWLALQANPYGGFISTQDTVRGIEALSAFAGLIYTPNLSIRATFEWLGGRKVFTIDRQNSLVLQQHDIKPSPDKTMKIHLKARGSGIFAAMVSWFYHVARPALTPSFGLTVRIVRQTSAQFTLRVCVQYLRSGVSSMSLLEVGVPTGYEVDTKLSKTKGAQRTETADRKFILYFETIRRVFTCVYITMNENAAVANRKPSIVRVYDYYSPDDERTKFYLLRRASVSKACPTC